MWIFLSDAFLCVVASAHDSDRLLVRAVACGFGCHCIYKFWAFIDKSLLVGSEVGPQG